MRKSALLIVIICFAAELFFFGAQCLAHMLLFSGFPIAAASMFADPAWKGVALYTADRWSEAAASFAQDISSDYNMGNALTRAGRYTEAIEAYERALTADPGDSDAAFNKALVEAAIHMEPRTGAGQPASAISTSRAIKAGGSRDRPPTDGGPGGSGEGLASGNETKGQSSAGGKVTKDGVSIARQGEQNTGMNAGAAGTSGGAGHSGDLQPNYPDLLQERESRMRRRQQEASIHPSLEWLQTLSDDPGRFLKAKIIAEKARRLRNSGGPIPEDD
jgi:Ca-activated chloride channel family protein